VNRGQSVYPLHPRGVLASLQKLNRGCRTLRPAVEGIFLAGLTMLALGFSCLAAEAQTGEWTWMGGSSTANQPGVYGMLGAPATGNVPGSRQQTMSWTDSSGHFWLFGGFGPSSTGTADTNGYLNDLWEFDPATSEWTWVSGSSTVPAFGGGQPGVYGTLGTPAAGNVPGGRIEAVSWTDGEGHLWLFGGEGYDSTGMYSYLNDLWEFDPATSEWTWMGGSNIGQQTGVYGTLGTPAAGNIPGARYGAVSWTDSNGRLWLFGGDGWDSTGSLGPLNDLWVFDPSTSEWTWMGGSSTANQRGAYGTLGTPAAGNAPGSRWDSVSWTDSSGHLWLLGGNGYDSLGNLAYLNDLWEFDPSKSEWTWMSGSSVVQTNPPGQPGVYGTLGTAAPENTPGGRFRAVSWTDPDGNFWLFGGEGDDSTNTFGDLNDLWEFDPATSEWTWMGGSSTVDQTGIYGTLLAEMSREVATAGWPGSIKVVTFGFLGGMVISPIPQASSTTFGNTPLRRPQLPRLAFPQRAAHTLQSRR